MGSVGGGVGFFQARYRQHGTRIMFLVILLCILMRWEGGGVCFYQTHSRDKGSLFLVIFAMYFNVIGREGTVLSDTL